MLVYGSNEARDSHQDTPGLLAVCPVAGELRQDLAAPDISGSGPVKPGESVARGGNAC
jgi:hypothetical protein